MFFWGSHQQVAFKQLCDAFVVEPILTLWQPERPTWVEVNALGFAVGGVLLQQAEDRQRHPVVFRSALMIPARQNCKIHNWKMLALIEMLKD